MTGTETPRERSAGRHLWEIAAVRDLAWLLLAIGVLWLGYRLRSIFTPVLVALLLAYLFDPLITKAQVWARMPRPLTISLILLTLALVTAAFAVFLAPLLVEQIVALVKKLGAEAETFARHHGVDLGTAKAQLDALADRASKDPMSLLQQLFAGTSRAFGFIGGVIGATSYVVLTLVLIPFYFFFFAWRLDRMRKVVRFVPASHHEHTLRILRRMDHAVGGFFRARVVISLATGVCFAVGWWASGVPYWFLLGMATGFLNLVPYAAIVGWPTALLLKHLEVVGAAAGVPYPWLAVFLWPSVVYLAVQFLDGWVLTPWLQGKSTDLGTVTILIVVFVGGALAGLYGLILAIPVAACVKIVMADVVLPRLEAWARAH